MEAVRRERNEAGREAVASGAYYGIRTKHAMERVIHTGKDYKHDLIVALAALKKEMATAEIESGRLDGRLGSQIVRAAREVTAGRWHEQLVLEPDRCGNEKER